MLEALKCLCNLVFNSQLAQRICRFVEYDCLSNVFLATQRIEDHTGRCLPKTVNVLREVKRLTKAGSIF